MSLHQQDAKLLESDIEKLQQTVSEVKKAFVDSFTGVKRRKIEQNDVGRAQIAANVLQRFNILRQNQQETAYLVALLELKKIDAQLVDGTELGTIRQLAGQLEIVKAGIDREDLKTGDRANLHQRLNACAIALHDSTSRSILAKLKEQKDGSYIPTIEEASNFAVTIYEALKIHQNQALLPPILDVFQILVTPFQARFSYHFGSRRPTNRLDKPEWALQHILALIEQYHAVIVEVIQPALQRALPTSGLLASHEFIRALLPMVAIKAQEMRKQLLDKTSLLIHMIAELKRFDDTLREDFGFCNRDQSYWSGISSEFLSDEVFEVWCSAEESFVHQRFIAITEDTDAFEIVGEADTTCIAPNPSSTKIIDLFEAMTRKFSPLEDLAQRQQFKVRIQSTILNDYLDKIRASTDAFETLTSGFSGGFPTNDIAGETGLRRLCRQLSGVSNVLARISDWHDDPFYIALDNSTRTEAFSAEFEEYAALQRRIERLIVSHLQRELSQDLRPYLRAQNWSSEEVPSSTIASTGTSSSQLIDFYSSVTKLFGYLTSVGSVLLVHRIYIAMAKEIDTQLMSNVIHRASFSRRGALQFKRDVLQIWFSFSAYVARPDAGMRGVSDALIVLSDGLDEHERSQLAKIEEAMTRPAEGDKRRSLKDAGVVCMTPSEVRSLMRRKLFSSSS